MSYLVRIDNIEYKIAIEKKGEYFKILLNDKKIDAEMVAQDRNSRLTLIIDNKSYDVVFDTENMISVNGENYNAEVVDEQIKKLIKASPKSIHKKELTINAPMPGLIIEIEAKEGDAVRAGQGLVIVEAMKMQNEMKAPRDGVVKQILVKKGQTVNSRDTLVIIE